MPPLQVHEKSILLPLLPVTMMAGRLPSLATWMPLVGSFSMFPLLVRDGVAVPYAALCVLYAVLMWPASTALQATLAARQVPRAAPTSGAAAASEKEAPSEQEAAAAAIGDASRGAKRGAWARWQPACGVAAVVVAVGLHVARVVVVPPARLLWLHDRLFITAAFGALVPMLLFLQWWQWTLPAAPQQQQARRPLKGAGNKDKNA